MIGPLLVVKETLSDMLIFQTLGACTDLSLQATTSPKYRTVKLFKVNNGK